MSTKKIGPKGQVLIPNTIREALGLRPGVEVNIELKGDEIVITRPKIEGSYTKFYLQTRTQKLTAPIDVKKIILEEDNERIGIR